MPSSLSSPFISLDLLQLYEGLREKLPAYARPIFVRLVNKIDVTGKHSRPYLLIMHETRGSNDMTNMILSATCDKGNKYFQPLTNWRNGIFRVKASTLNWWELKVVNNVAFSWSPTCKCKIQNAKTQMLLFHYIPRPSANYKMQNEKCKIWKGKCNC